MANLNTNLVTTGQPWSEGGIWVGPVNNDGKATLPTDATTKLPTGYKCLGWVTSDGVSVSTQLSTSDTKAWGGNVINSARTEYGETFTFSLAELSKTVMETIWDVSGASGSDTSGYIIDHNPSQLDNLRVYVIIVQYQDGSFGRRVIPMGRISSLGDVSYKDDTIISQNLTITALPGGFPSTVDARTTSREYKSATDATIATASLTSGTIPVEADAVAEIKEQEKAGK